jgi:hypothetical protein
VKVCKICERSDVTFYPSRAKCKGCYIHHVQRVYGASEKGSARRTAARIKHAKSNKGKLTKKLYYQKNPQALQTRIIYKGVHSYIRKNGKGTIKFRAHIGCTAADFRNYIESQFVANMSWENYGTVWQVDHILSLHHHDLTKIDQFAAACHFSNCRPLFKADNYKRPKNTKYSERATVSFDKVVGWKERADMKLDRQFSTDDSIFQFATSPLSPLDDPEDLV